MPLLMKFKLSLWEENIVSGKGNRLFAAGFGVRWGNEKRYLKKQMIGLD